MTRRTLDQWLEWQTGLNPKDIELGLERVSRVWEALGAPSLNAQVVTIAGTNGKGSCVALLEAVMRSAGYRVGCYTSPHIERYNERIRIDGLNASDEAICEAFERIEAARADTPLTYFEFGTLAGLLLFSQSDLDLVILEVGLGGRLDAVNMIDADVALVTGIALDHTDWLGDSIEQIAAEKAGVFRTGKAAIYAAPDMPKAIAQAAQERGAHLSVLGEDYHYEKQPSGWHWQNGNTRRFSLPQPALRGSVQLQNAAAVLQVIDCLAESLPVNQAAIRDGLLAARIEGRFEVHQRSCRWVLDVAHNPQAVKVLAKQLGDVFTAGSVHAVVGMLRDKAIADACAEIDHRIDEWHVIDLSSEHRGASAVEVAGLLDSISGEPVNSYLDIKECLDDLDRVTTDQDLVVVFGSFVTVAAVKAWMRDNS